MLLKEVRILEIATASVKTEFQDMARYVDTASMADLADNPLH